MDPDRFTSLRTLFRKPIGRGKSHPESRILFCMRRNAPDLSIDSAYKAFENPDGARLEGNNPFFPILCFRKNHNPLSISAWRIDVSCAKRTIMGRRRAIFFSSPGLRRLSRPGDIDSIRILATGLQSRPFPFLS